MGGHQSWFGSSHLTTPLASLTKRNHNHLRTALLCAEISFLVTLTVFAGLRITDTYASRRTTFARFALHGKGLVHPLQGCSLSLPVQAVSPKTIAKSSFTVLEWLSTDFSPIPSFQQEGIRYSGPSALLDEGSAVSCFAFAGSRGGAVLVSNSERYHVIQFTLDNSVLGVATGSDYYPKEGALWGLFEGVLPWGLGNATTSFVTDNVIYVLIGSFCFDPEQGSIQTFAVDADIATFPNLKFSAFYLEVLSNWGGSHTCVCHLTLHSNP